MISSLAPLLQSFSSIPGLDLVDLITGLGVLAILFVIYAESGLLIGFFLPGDSLLFTAGILVNAGTLNINIHLFVILLFIAAVLGDSTGYWFGKKTGPMLFKKPDARLFKQKYIKQARDFYEKHGGKTIIIARFVPIVRTFAPIVAGASSMNYRKFLMFNVLGGFLWTFGITYLGYFLGSVFRHFGIDIDHVLLPIIALIILASVLPPAIHILKYKSNRQKIIEMVQKQLKAIFRK
jgi:membrane-associated protein